MLVFHFFHETSRDQFLSSKHRCVSETTTPCPSLFGPILPCTWCGRLGGRSKQNMFGDGTSQKSLKNHHKTLKKTGNEKHMNSSKTFNKQNKMFYHQLGWGAQIRCLICFWEFHQGFDPRLCSARATSSRVHGRPGPLIFLHALPPPHWAQIIQNDRTNHQRKRTNEHPGL